MKKRILSLLLALLLGLALGSAAAGADDTVTVNLGTAEAGASIDRLLGVTERGVAETVPGLGEPPQGCRLETEQKEEGACHYLRGVPTLAGSYDFTLYVRQPREGEEPELIAELKCSLTVVPATPSLSISPDVNCRAGEETSLLVTASVGDGGTLSYQWYSNTARSNQNGTLLGGATGATLRLTPIVGTSYYYCVVTNQNNGRSVTASSAAVAVTAAESKPVSLSVSVLPTKLEYEKGETPDTAGLQLRLAYSDGRTETVSSGYRVSPARLDSVGNQNVTLSYAGLSCSYSVTVKEEAERVLGVQVLILPDKLSYTVGDWLDTAGMVLRVDTNKGSYEVSTGFTCTPRTLDAEGRQAVTVQYGSSSALFYVEVSGADERVESIVVSRRPARLSYAVGDYFDPLGMSLIVQSNHGAREVTEGFTWMPQQFTAAGRQDVTISYQGKRCTLELIVEEARATAAPTESPEPTAAPTPTPAPSAGPLPTATPRPDTHVERRSGRTAVTVILVAAFTGLAALLGYVLLAKRESLHAFFAPHGKGRRR